MFTDVTMQLLDRFNKCLFANEDYKAPLSIREVNVFFSHEQVKFFDKGRKAKNCCDCFLLLLDINDPSLLIKVCLVKILLPE